MKVLNTLVALAVAGLSYAAFANKCGEKKDAKACGTDKACHWDGKACSEAKGEHKEGEKHEE